MTIAALDEKIAIIKHELNITNENAKVLVGDVRLLSTLLLHYWKNAFSMWLRSTIEFIECNFQR